MDAKAVARYGMLSALMLVLGLIERQFVLVPTVPGIRLGLANTVLLYAVCLMSAKDAWLLMALKVLLGTLLYAGASGLPYALAGGVLSVLAMLLTARVKGVGMVGVSVCGAVLHMAGQILASRVMLGTWAGAAQAPYLLIAAVVTGVITGVAARSASGAIARNDPAVKKRMRALGLLGGEDGSNANDADYPR